MTWKLPSSFTVTYVPSDLRRCASYAAGPESVSTRTTVAPGTAASAAAFAFAAAAPVRSVSPGPWLIWAGSPIAPFGGRCEEPFATNAAGVPAWLEPVAEPPVAAPAMPAAPAAMPSASAPVTMNPRALCVVITLL